MSVLIKGLKMPNIDECITITIHGNGDSEIHSDEGGIFWRNTVVEVPTPHGRLIDAAELCNAIEEKITEPYYQSKYNNWLTGLYMATNCIYKLPTIVESEKS